MRRLGGGLGAVGLLAAAVGLLVNADAFFQGYLAAYVFWISLPLGCLALLMIHHLNAGSWGFVAQRHFEAGAQTIGLLAVLFIPLFFGMHTLYEWTHQEAVAHDALLQHKRPYLNAPFFILRNVIYFAFWITTAYFLSQWSLRLDETEDAAYARKLRRLSAGGLVGHVLLLTFASVDWIMSLEPHWFSTIFGWLLAVSQTLVALCVTILVLNRLRGREPLAGLFRRDHLHDFGNLTFAFVILWAYMMFAQFFIIWAGNIPEDVEWYAHRLHTGWGWVGPVLIVFHFAIPFLLLLSRRVKRSPRMLGSLAVGVLVMHVLYVAWLVLPSFSDLSVHAFWIGAAAFVGMGGLWSAAYAWLLGRRALLPAGDPRLKEAFESV